MLKVGGIYNLENYYIAIIEKIQNYNWFIIIFYF